MNEIKHIHLGRQQFTIAVDAHSNLRRYLDDIAKQSGAMSDDVVAEVELRMAELLMEHGLGSEKVVLLKDVEFLMAQLGEPRDFKDDSKEDGVDDEVGDEQPQRAPKRLYRDTEHGLVAGVASGLANFLGVDPLIVRLVFVVVTFAGGSSFLIYILMWLLVPEAKTASDKLSMSGKRVTIDSLKGIIDDADVAGTARRAQHSLQRVLAVVSKMVLVMVGSVLTLVASLALLFVMIVAASVLVSGAKVAGEIVFPFGSHEVGAFVAIVVAVAIALLLLILTGIAMVRRRWQLSAWGTAALVGLFFVAATFGAAFTADIVPSVTDRVEHLQHITTSETAAGLKGFTSAEFSGEDTRFVFVPNAQYSIEYRYFGKVDTAAISAKVEGATLKIDTNNVSTDDGCTFMCIHSGSDLQVIIHAPALENVTVVGVQANFISSHTLNQKRMTIEASPDAMVSVTNVDMQDVTLKANSHGSRSIMLNVGTGQTDSSKGIDVHGDGIVTLSGVKKFNFETQSQCDESGPFVFLQNNAGSIAVNGRVVDIGQLSEDQTERADNANCLVVR